MGLERLFPIFLQALPSDQQRYELSLKHHKGFKSPHLNHYSLQRFELNKNTHYQMLPAPLGANTRPKDPYASLTERSYPLGEEFVALSEDLAALSEELSGLSKEC